MSSVMGKQWFSIYQHHHYHDIIICNWELNGVNYNDSITETKSDYLNIGYSHGLWSLGYFSFFDKTDQKMLNQYIISSICGK